MFQVSQSKPRIDRIETAPTVKVRAAPVKKSVFNLFRGYHMATVTDTDLQQLKDLITTLHAVTQKQITDGNTAIQRQITDGNAAIQKQIAGVEIGLSEVKGEIKEVKAEIKGVQIQVSDIKADQRSQDTRFFWLFAFLLTTAVGIVGKLVKFY
jgi:peptidoglycan hydrolase CwlO-like protein